MNKVVQLKVVMEDGVFVEELAWLDVEIGIGNDDAKGREEIRRTVQFLRDVADDIEATGAEEFGK